VYYFCYFVGRKHYLLISYLLLPQKSQLLVLCLLRFKNTIRGLRNTIHDSRGRCPGPSTASSSTWHPGSRLFHSSHFHLFFFSPTNLCLSVCVAFLGLASDIPGRLSGSSGIWNGWWKVMEGDGRGWEGDGKRWKMRKFSYEFISNWGNMITAMMMLFRFNIVNIFRLSCVYLRALLVGRGFSTGHGRGQGRSSPPRGGGQPEMSFCHAKVALLK